MEVWDTFESPQDPQTTSHTSLNSTLAHQKGKQLLSSEDKYTRFVRNQEFLQIKQILITFTDSVIKLTDEKDQYFERVISINWLIQNFINEKFA